MTTAKESPSIFCPECHVFFKDKEINLIKFNLLTKKFLF